MLALMTSWNTKKWNFGHGCTIPIVNSILVQRRYALLSEKGLLLAQASLLTRTHPHPPHFAFASPAQKVTDFTTKTH